MKVANSTVLDMNVRARSNNLHDLHVEVAYYRLRAVGYVKRLSKKVTE